MGLRFSLLLLTLSACSLCHARRDPLSDSGSNSDGQGELPRAPPPLAPPLAATRGRSGATTLAGVVAARGAVAVTALDDRGKSTWSVDVLSGVSSTNAELRAFPSGDGVVVVYRGRREGRSVTEAVAVTSDGGVSGPVIEAGPLACATDGALAWITLSKGGSSRVMSAPWGWGPISELSLLPPDRDPTLVCGARTIFALGDGERDTTALRLPGAQGPSVVMRERDFSDDEREHDTFVTGDTVGLVRVGQSGALSVREIGSEGVGPWHHFAARLLEGDDVVAVDGDRNASIIVFTKDDGGGCDGPGAPSVHALYRSSEPEVERRFDLAPAECGTDAGPFWTGAIGGWFVVGWVERASMRSPGDAPIRGLAFQTIGATGAGELRRLSRPADEMVDAGCDKDHCYAVALATEASGAQRIETLVYPSTPPAR
jgi:hypothetical protein